MRKGVRLWTRSTLAAVLEFYAQAVEAGVISPGWPLSCPMPGPVGSGSFRERAGMTVVDSRQFWAAEVGREIEPAPFPTRDGRPIALARGSIVGLVAEDPERQALAMEFVAWLLEPGWYGEWTQGVGATSRRAERAGGLGRRWSGGPCWRPCWRARSFASPSGSGPGGAGPPAPRRGGADRGDEPAPGRGPGGAVRKRRGAAARSRRPPFLHLHHQGLREGRQVVNLPLLVYPDHVFQPDPIAPVRVVEARFHGENVARP